MPPQGPHRWSAVEVSDLPFAVHRRHRSGNTIHGAGQINIERGHAASIMGGEDDFDGFIDIAPVRMVIEPFGGQRDPRHKSERFAEITESERFADRFSA